MYDSVRSDDRGGGGYGRGYGGTQRGGGGYGAGFQGGDRGRGGGSGGYRGGGRGGGGGGREGDWPCPNASCGNLNFARRTECNKCGAANPASAAGGGGGRGGHSGGGSDYHRGGSGDYNKGGRESYNNRGSGDSSRGRGDDFDRGRGGYGGNRNERSGGYGGGGDEGRGGGYRSGGSDAGKGNDYGSGSEGGKGVYYGVDDSAYNQVPPPNQSSYGGAPGSYSHPNSYTGNSGYGSDAAPPASYTGGTDSYPPSYSTPQGSYGSVPNSYGGAPPSSFGAPPNSYGSAEMPTDVRGGGGRSGTSHRGGYTGRDSVSKHSSAGGYSASPVEQKVKQCDGNCGDDCDNSRIYISNLPLDVTVDELKELFGSIGQVGRIKQKRGYKDQWPWNIKIYTDDNGNYKGDAVLSYEDPFAAHAAGGFYNNYDLRGHKISVAMAEKTAPRAPSYQHGGGRGGHGGGGRSRDGSHGPDRNSSYGGHRSRPY